MTLDGSYTATLDRIVSELAVLLVEEHGTTIAQRTAEETRLPDGIDGEGSTLHLEFDDGKLVAIDAPPDRTHERRRQARTRFERLAVDPPAKG